MAVRIELDAYLAPRFREELRGLSDATGLPYADLLLINTFDDLQHVSGCSFAVGLAANQFNTHSGRSNSSRSMRPRRQADFD